MLGSFLKRSENRNVATLLVGTVLSQAIPIAISPILTRLFTPSDFGVFALYFSLTMIFSVIVTGRYEMAIMLPKDEKEALTVAKLSMLLSLVIALFLFVLFILFKSEIALFLKSPEIENWLLLLPITVFIIGVYQSLNYYVTRFEAFKALAFSRFFRSLNTSLFSLILGFFKLGNNGLIIGDTIGQAGATGMLFWRMKRMKGFQNFPFEWIKAKELAKKYKHFPAYNVPSGLLEKGSGQVPVLLLTNFFGNAFVGMFSLSQRVISAPSGIVARAFGDVFRQRATKEYAEKGECSELFKANFKKLFLLSVVPFSVLLLFAPPIFEWVFGEEWRMAGVYAQIMTPMFFLQFTVSPLSNMFYVAEKQKTDLVIQLVLFLALCVGLFIGFTFFDSSTAALVIFTFIYSLKYIIELILSYKFSIGK